MAAKHKVRKVEDVFTAHRQQEGAGFIVRRPFPSNRASYIDPFLLIDEMGPMEYLPGEAVGAPDHPHRGFETVTYMLEGQFEHEDSVGHRGLISAGDVQWMTAGSGVIHSEMPSKKIRQHGGTVHGFQIWVNLPKAHKLDAPKYQERKRDEIPVAKTEDGTAQGVIIAGRALGVSSVIDTHIPITFQDWTLRQGADVTLALDPEERAMVYVFGGALIADESAQVIEDGQLAILGSGDAVRLRHAGSAPARALLLAGKPIEEPVARYGPFVMNTQAELQQAFADYQSGKMGRIMRGSHAN